MNHTPYDQGRSDARWAKTGSAKGEGSDGAPKRASGTNIVMLVGYANAQSPADVSGTWTGSTTTGSSTLTLVLKQEGKTVTGTLTGAGTDDGPVTGTVDGNTIRLRNNNGGTPLLNVKGDQITGMTSAGSSVTMRRISK